jgi:RimJ/RimL family protein N-acetyltransferase
VIRGELTNLRAVERTDAGVLFRCFNTLDGPRGWSHGGPPVSLSEVQRRIEGWLDEERTFGRPAALMIEDLNGGSVGAILLTNYEPQHRALEVSLLTGQQDVWDESLETDALQSLIDSAFDQWNLNRITSRAPVENERLAIVCEACGFSRDIVFRESAYFDGAYHDVALYCLLRTDRDRETETDGA